MSSTKEILSSFLHVKIVLFLVSCGKIARWFQQRPHNQEERKFSLFLNRLVSWFMFHKLLYRRAVREKSRKDENICRQISHRSEWVWRYLDHKLGQGLWFLRFGMASGCMSYSTPLRSDRGQCEAKKALKCRWQSFAAKIHDYRSERIRLRQFTLENSPEPPPNSSLSEPRLSPTDRAAIETSWWGSVWRLMTGCVSARSRLA